MPNFKPEEIKFDWKDHELDAIWHKGIKRFIDKEITEYDLISFIEVKIESAINREFKALQDEIEKGKRMVITTEPDEMNMSDLRTQGYNAGLDFVLNLFKK